MKIDITKQYQTRDGREVRLFTTASPAAWPIIGAVKEDSGWSNVSWKADGTSAYPPSDLVEVVKRYEQDIFIHNETNQVRRATITSRGALEGDPAWRLARVREVLPDDVENEAIDILRQWKNGAITRDILESANAIYNRDALLAKLDAANA